MGWLGDILDGATGGIVGDAIDVFDKASGYSEKQNRKKFAQERREKRIASGRKTLTAFDEESGYGNLSERSKKAIRAIGLNTTEQIQGKSVLSPHNIRNIKADYNALYKDRDLFSKATNDLIIRGMRGEDVHKKFSGSLATGMNETEKANIKALAQLNLERTKANKENSGKNVFRDITPTKKSSNTSTKTVNKIENSTGSIFGEL